jgi:hypothetical protein
MALIALSVLNRRRKLGRQTTESSKKFKKVGMIQRLSLPSVLGISIVSSLLAGWCSIGSIPEIRIRWRRPNHRSKATVHTIEAGVMLNSRA